MQTAIFKKIKNYYLLKNSFIKAMFMKKIIFLFAILFATNSLLAQTTDEARKTSDYAAKALSTKKQIKDGWTTGGTFNFVLSEAGRNDAWGIVKGGEEQTIGIKAIIDFDFDKKKGKTSWLNNFRARYGMTKTTSAGSGFNKTDDYINYTSTYAIDMKNPKWSFAILFSLETQFDKYFLSPGSLKLGPGFMYKPDNKFSLIFSPAIINVTTKLATEQKALNLFGVDADKTLSFAIGAFVQAKADYDIAKGINYKGFATFYSNYLKNPGNIIMDWTNLITMTVNKHIGATVSVNLRYNDLEVGKLQIQHGIGVGLSYQL